MVPAIYANTVNPIQNNAMMENGIMAFTVTSFPGSLAVRHVRPSHCRNCVQRYTPAPRAYRAWPVAWLPPKMLQEIMGHASITTTLDLYGRLYPG